MDHWSFDLLLGILSGTTLLSQLVPQRKGGGFHTGTLVARVLNFLWLFHLTYKGIEKPRRVQRISATQGRYPEMPWHSPGVNGWHEDFHLVVALADLAFCMMAYDASVIKLSCFQKRVGWCFLRHDVVNNQDKHVFLGVTSIPIWVLMAQPEGLDN